MSEIRSLTGLRGVAALIVVLFHLEYIPEPWNRLHVFVNNGYLGVDLFFVLSGYVLALNYGRAADFSTFLRRRFARTYPLYLCTTLSCLVLLASGAVPLVALPGQIVCGAWALVPNLMLVQNWGTPFCSLNPPGWSISNEWGAYLAFPLLCQLALVGDTKRCFITIGISVAFLIGLSIAPDHWVHWRGGPLNLSDGVTPAPLLRCLADFTLGMAAYRFSTRVDGGWSVVLTMAIVAAGMFEGADIIVVLLFPGLVMALGADRGPVSAFLGWKPIYFLGLISYSIYLWHFPIVQIAKQSFKWIPIGYRNLVVDATTLAAVLLISTLSFYLIERPGRRFLSAPRASMSPA